MTRTTENKIDRSTLPEHLRSKAVGAVIAETLEAAVTRDQVYTGALGDLITGAADEIRTFLGLPEPAPSTNGFGPGRETLHPDGSAVDVYRNYDEHAGDMA